MSKIGGRLEKKQKTHKRHREKVCRKENEQINRGEYGFYRPNREVETSVVKKQGDSEETCLETLENASSFDTWTVIMIDTRQPLV